MNSPDFEDLTIDLDAAAGVIGLKAAGSFGDAVELSADVARELAAQLARLADELE